MTSKIIPPNGKKVPIKKSAAVAREDHAHAAAAHEAAIVAYVELLDGLPEDQRDAHAQAFRAVMSSGVAMHAALLQKFDALDAQRRTAPATAGKANAALRWKQAARRIAAPYLAAGKAARWIVAHRPFWAEFEAECAAIGVTTPAPKTVRGHLS